MDLRALLAEVETPSVAGDAHRTIEGIAHDSPGGPPRVFVCRAARSDA